MADSSVAVTAGTGTNVDTRTEGTNGNHRQVIVIGDPATNSGVAPVDATAGLKVDLGADNDVTVSGGALTALQALEGTVSGTEVQVDIVAALPAGSNSIGAVTNTHLTNALIGDYETVAASQTAQTLGATGGTGDFLSAIVVIPATTSPGNVIILDNATSITVFTGGASSVSNLVPFVIPLGMRSVSGAWKVTTGSNVSVIAIGNFA
jgi:hypothetical protein